MTLDDVKAALAETADWAKEGDDEMAHREEASLREDFIRHVAEAGPPELAEMAREVLKTEEIEFSRWFA
jgi:hypothetical protein